MATTGILNIDKPRGITSFAVVSRVRRATGIRRVGHAGTLDPEAEGVLPVCLGSATRVVEYLMDTTKVYRATVMLGAATDTYDSEGSVVSTGDWSSVTREALEAALAPLTGAIQQLPPMYSAVKHRGQPLYKYARAGKDAPRALRTVHVYRLDVVAFAPPSLELEIEVGKGAYVRSLAHDLGERLGCFAHLRALTRLRVGPFQLRNAIELDAFLELAERGEWEDCLHSPDSVLESWLAAILGEEHSRHVAQGRLIDVTPVESHRHSDFCRAYSYTGDFLAILRNAGGNRWKPEKVFASR
jgi:tRNA pseudouridine55 synthase